jgi:hypothetical protein
MPSYRHFQHFVIQLQSNIFSNTQSLTFRTPIWRNVSRPVKHYFQPLGALFRNIFSKYTSLVVRTQTSTSNDMVKVKVNLSLCLNNEAPGHEGVRGSGCINPHFLDLGISWRWVVSFTPRPIYPRGKSPRYPLNKRLCGPQSRSGKNIFPLPGIEPRLWSL